MIGVWTLGSLVNELSGQLVGADTAFSQIVIDSRKDCSGALFVALVGTHFNGHDFVEAAFRQGAVALLVSEPVTSGLPQIVVQDTLLALGQLGAINRSRFKGPVLTVTGSAGKTSVKEMIAGILGECGKVCATRGNLNNEIGAPLSLLQLDGDHEYGVFELGASSIGEIEYTVNLVKPDVAIITNAADAHVEGFGSLDAVVQAKGEILDGLGDRGVAVLNLDDLNAYKWIERAGQRAIRTFSVANKAEADVGAEQIRLSAEGSEFLLRCGLGQIPVHLNLLGQHNIANALAAGTACLQVGASLQQVAAGLGRLQPVAGRLTWKQGLKGARLIDDSYNASPEAVIAAIDVLADCDGNRVLVLGDMAELGDHSVKRHQDIGRYASKVGIERVFCVGPHCRFTVEAFGEGARHFESQEALIEELRSQLTEQSVVLVKGSRRARMERVVDAIQAGETSCC